MGWKDTLLGRRAGPGSVQKEATPASVLLAMAQVYWQQAADDDDEMFAVCARLSSSTGELLAQEVARVEADGSDGTPEDDLLLILGGFLSLTEEHGGTVAGMHAANAACLAHTITTLLDRTEEGRKPARHRG